jgi:proteasome alpha subunit
VAILDANRPRRAFRRITGAALDAVLASEASESGAGPGGAGLDTTESTDNGDGQA